MNTVIIAVTILQRQDVVNGGGGGIPANAVRYYDDEVQSSDGLHYYDDEVQDGFVLYFDN